MIGLTANVPLRSTISKKKKKKKKKKNKKKINLL